MIVFIFVYFFSLRGKKKKTNKIHLYIKGADDEILTRLEKSGDNPDYKQLVVQVDLFASEGLRTLMFAQREMPVKKNYNKNHFFRPTKTAHLPCPLLLLLSLSLLFKLKAFYFPFAFRKCT